MILSEEEIEKIYIWLNITTLDDLSKLPDPGCNCVLCKLAETVELTQKIGTHERTSKLQWALEHATKLHERFGQCDLDLLKHIYKNHETSAN